MDKSKKSQVLVLISLAFLLLMAHLLPSTMRPPFLYFIFNLLIISLGAEAGLLSPSSSSSSMPLQDKTTSSCSCSSSPLIRTQKPVIMAHEAISELKEKASISVPSQPKEKKVILVTVTKPSLFFIACEETEDAEEEAMNNEEDEAEDEEEDQEGESERVIINEEEELCAKAEAFIGNFYKQLKIQREESWKKIRYQKAF